MSRHRLLPLFAALLATSLHAADAPPTNRLTSIQRLDPARLAAARTVRERLARERETPLQHGLHRDFRAVIHVHAEDSDHTRGTRDEVLAAAKKAGVDIVMWTDHRGPKADTWRGLREGVLFIAGSEDDEGVLRFPEYDATGAPQKASLRFLSHTEDHPDATTKGFAGMEIVNRHTDAKLDRGLQLWLAAQAADPARWTNLVALFKKYPDEVFAAGCDRREELFSRWDGELRARRVTGIGANDAHQNQLFGGVTFDPYEVSFRNLTTHILATELTEAAVREALRAGRAYVAHDWLCDPTGFVFGSVNNLGVFPMGGSAPFGLLANSPRIAALTPVPAHMRLFRDGKLIAESFTKRLEHSISDDGVYRVEAWLEVAGELRPWIYSNPVYVGGDSLAALKNLRVPPSETPPGVAVRRAQRHTHGAEADAAKQSLDVYWPTNRTGLPVLFFIHGGAWRFGDRAQYFAIGNHFARHGFVTVLPGYRLAPAHKHPAQIEDVAAAFAWTVRHAAEFGGDTNRIVIAGHSAGGHLAALLALDTRRLAAHGLSPAALRGVAGLSGVYDIVMAEGQPKVFTTDVAVQRDASPMTHVKPGAPPFLLTYCEFDYYSLPTQARLFQTALNKAGVPAQLHYTPDENHISEVMAYLDDRNATAKELLRFLREAVK